MSRDIECRTWEVHEDSNSALSGKVTIMGASFDSLYSDDVLCEVLGEDGGTDVQMMVDANRSGQNPLARIMMFFDHIPGIRPPGARHEDCVVKWAVVQEYATEGIGQSIRPDQATQLPLYKLRKTRELYPFDAVTRIVHMTHACTSSGLGSCRLQDEGGRPKWVHNHATNRKFLHNNYYDRCLLRR